MKREPFLGKADDASQRGCLAGLCWCTSSSFSCARSRARLSSALRRPFPSFQPVHTPFPLMRSHLPIPTRSCCRSFLNCTLHRPPCAGGRLDHAGQDGSTLRAAACVACCILHGACRVAPDAAPGLVRLTNQPAPGTCATCGTDSTSSLSSRRSSTSASLPTGQAFSRAKAFLLRQPASRPVTDAA